MSDATSTAPGAEPEPVLDTDALAAWLDTQDVAGTGQEITYRFLSGGSQNQIFEITRGDLHGALRIPPPPAPESRDEGILREYRIIEALDGTDVPHTEAIAACRDTAVLGRSFYIMGFVDGWSCMDDRDGWPAPFDTDLDARQGLAYQLVEGPALMGKVDWQGRGLGDLGRPDGYHERQVERWTRFLDRIKGRELPGFDEASAWLGTHAPLDFVPGLMHGDYQFANVMYEHGAPARLAAIVDWEMGTIGDPKIDLAWVMQSWPTDMSEPPPMSYVDMAGMPAADDLLHHFSTLSGRQVDDMDYYYVLARWKLAIVLEQGFQRAGGDPKLQAFGQIVLDLMASAGDLAASSSYTGGTD